MWIVDIGTCGMKTMILLNPRQHTCRYPDERLCEIMRKTIGFFEERGKHRLKEDDRGRVWYADFLEFQRQSRSSPLYSGATVRRWPRSALGHVAHLRVQRNPGVLWALCFAVSFGLIQIGPRPRIETCQVYQYASP